MTWGYQQQLVFYRLGLFRDSPKMAAGRQINTKLHRRLSLSHPEVFLPYGFAGLSFRNTPNVSHEWHTVPSTRRHSQKPTAGTLLNDSRCLFLCFTFFMLSFYFLCYLLTYLLHLDTFSTDLCFSIFILIPHPASSSWHLAVPFTSRFVCLDSCLPLLPCTAHSINLGPHLSSLSLTIKKWVCANLEKGAWFLRCKGIIVNKYWNENDAC